MEKNVHQLCVLFHDNMKKFCHYWLNITLKDCVLENLGDIFKVLLCHSIRVQIDSRFIYWLEGAPWSRFPLRLLGKSDCSVIQHLLSGVRSHKTFHLHVDGSYRVRYDRFRYNSYLDGRFRRIVLLKVFVGEVVSMLPLDVAWGKCALILVSDELKRSASDNLFRTHPLHRNVLRFCSTLENPISTEIKK